MIFGDHWSFVQNPKAASSAATDALLPFCRPQHPRAFPDGKPSKHHIPRAGAVPLKVHRAGIVRNPYDRMVSAWTYLQERAPEKWGDVSFREFVLDPDCVFWIGQKPRPIPFQRTPQLSWLVGCNAVLRFEDLGTGFRRWTERAIGQTVDIPRTNETRGRSRGYAGYYIAENGKGLDTALIERVRSDFHFDFEVWGYGF
jgi:hypothetical protein